MDQLLHGEEKAVFGDKGYFSDQDKRTARKTGLFWGVLDKAKSQKATQSQAEAQKYKAIEHTGQGGASVSGGQAAGWLHQDPVSGTEEKRRAGFYAVCAGQSVSSAACLVGVLLTAQRANRSASLGERMEAKLRTDTNHGSEI